MIELATYNQPQELTLSAVSSAGELDFQLPPELEASAPPEARGLSRDEVRLMVSYRADDLVIHTQFHDLPGFLDAGDVLVINTSGTLQAALDATREDGTPLELHLSTHLPADLWIVEVRGLGDVASEPFLHATAGETLRLPGGAGVTLLAPYSQDRLHLADGPTRLWIASLQLTQDLYCYLDSYGFPIRYSYVKQRWPIEAYQTVYATEYGSAE